MKLLLQAEWRLLWHRRICRLFVILSAISAIFVTLLFNYAIAIESDTLSDNLIRLLRVRNFFVLPLIYMLCAASSIAEDRQIGFMKEALCQPISRIQYLGATFAQSYSFMTSLYTSSI